MLKNRFFEKKNIQNFCTLKKEHVHRPFGTIGLSEINTIIKSFQSWNAQLINAMYLRPACHCIGQDRTDVLQYCSNKTLCREDHFCFKRHCTSQRFHTINSIHDYFIKKNLIYYLNN